MAIRERATLKTWFKKYAYPKAEQFADWIDSFIHKNDTIPVQSVENLTDLLNDKLDVGTGAAIERKADEAIAGLNLHGEQIQQIIENTNEIEDTLDEHAQHLATHDGQLSALEITVQQHGEQITALEADVSGLQTTVGGLQATTTLHGQKIGGLESTTQQLRTDLTAETAARTNKDTELNQQITDIDNRVAALRGAFIYRGIIQNNTDAITYALLNTFIQTYYKRTSELGDVVKDLDGMEWYYDGGAWLKLGRDTLPLASGTTAGIVANTGTGDLEYANGVATIKASKRIANPQKLAIATGGTTHEYDGTKAMNITIPEPEKPALANGTAEGTVKGGTASDIEYSNGIATIKAAKCIPNPHKLNMLVAGQTYQYDGTQAIDIDFSGIGAGVIVPEPEAANVYIIDSDTALADLNALDFTGLSGDEWISELIIKVKAGTWVYDGNQHGNNGIFINTTSWYEAQGDIHHRAIQHVKIVGENGARIVIRNAHNGGYMFKAGYLSTPHPRTNTIYRGGINASVHNLQLTFEGDLPPFNGNEFFDCLQGFVGIENCLITGNVGADENAGNYNSLIGMPISPTHKYCLSAANDCIYMRNSFINETKGNLVGYIIHPEELGAPFFNVPFVIDNCKIHAYKGGVHVHNDLNYWEDFDCFCALNITIRNTQFVQERKVYKHLYSQIHAAVLVYPYTFARTTINGCHFLITGDEVTSEYATVGVMGCGMEFYDTSLNGTNIYNTQIEIMGLTEYGSTIPLLFINRMQNSRVTNYMGFETTIAYAVGIRWCVGNIFEGGGDLNSVSTDGTSYQTVIDGTPAGGFNQYEMQGGF